MRLSAVCLLILLPLCAEITNVRLVERTDVLAGRSLGPAGPYERIIAKAHFALDPNNPANANIADLKLAPTNEKGLVEFTADLYVLKPRDSKKGNGTLLMEVSNRGGKGMLGRFNLARFSTDPRTEEELGDLMLMEQGFTLAWVGWQWDVPNQPGLLRLDAPIATLGGHPIEGLVRSEFGPSAKTTTMPLADRNHIAYPALDRIAHLTVRDSVLAPRRTIKPSDWKFTADRTAIEMAAGFQPGLLYEIVYTAQNPRVQGTGLAAFRDTAAFFKYTKNGVTLLGDQPIFIKRAIGFGISQSGRFLRTLLYYGMNEDEQGRRVFDGLWADVGGGGRGSFNHRFAQASRDGYAHFNTLYPTDIFPFSDLAQTDTLTKQSDGLLTHLKESTVPKIFYTNGSFEYWSRSAALVHASLDGRQDAPLGPNTRLYFVAGSQHGPGNLPRIDKQAQFPLNPNNHTPLQRALLIALHEWVRDGKEPPRSQYPLISENHLVPLAQVKWPKLPQFPKAAYRIDYGPTIAEPGKVGPPFPVLLPQVDADGIDLGGVRMPEVANPLGTFTGWNLRSPETGAPNQLAVGIGGFFAFTKTAIASRYQNKSNYLRLIDESTSRLIEQRLLLERDRARVAAHAASLWDAVNQ
jgi:hypothetical protein